MNSPADCACVDTHFHIFDAGVGIAGARYVPDYSAGLDSWHEQARGVGVGRGVLVQPSFLGTDNSLMLNALRACPDELRGVAVVESSVEPSQLKVLHDAGVRAIRLNLSGRSHDVSQWAQATGLWDTLIELGWHLELHTDRGGLPDVLTQLPGQMPLLIDHMGKPDTDLPGDPTFVALGQWMRRSSGAQVHIKLSGAYRLGGLDPAALARIWLDVLGESALLWGSDWPCTNFESMNDYQRLYASLERWIGSSYWEAIRSTNPLRVFWRENFP